MSDEEAKALAVEEVRRHLALSEKTQVRTSMRNAVAICITVIAACVGATWKVSGYLNEIQTAQTRIEDGLRLTQVRIEDGLKYKVSIGQFQAWTLQLDRLNRTTIPGFAVPDAPTQSRN